MGAPKKFPGEHQGRMEKAGPDGTGLFVVLGCCAEGRVVSNGSSLRFGPDMTEASPMDWLFARTHDACHSTAGFGTYLQACGSGRADPAQEPTCGLRRSTRTLSRHCPAHGPNVMRPMRSRVPSSRNLWRA